MSDFASFFYGSWDFDIAGYLRGLRKRGFPYVEGDALP